MANHRLLSFWSSICGILHLSIWGAFRRAFYDTPFGIGVHLLVAEKQ